MKNDKSKLVKESLSDFDTIASSLKENTAQMVHQLLGEAVRETYNKILTEDEDDENDYDVEEVNDTESEESNDTEETTEVSTDTEDAESSDDSTKDDTAEDVDVEIEDETSEDFTSDTEDDIVEDSDSEEEWADFDKYKVSDTEYDFSQADDEDVIKVYKLLKNDDQVFVDVDKESNRVEIKDNNTGAEYLLTLDGNGDNSLYLGYDDEDGTEEDLETSTMAESRVYEIVLNEYDSHVGYTDNYQNKDVMSNPGMSEPGKNVNDWDKGVPKGTSKPWVGKSHPEPFNGEKGKRVEECGAPDAEPMDEEEELAEATNVGGAVQQRSNSKSHIPSGRKEYGPKPRRHISTSEHGYDEIQESKMINKVNKILKENADLKKALVKFKTTLEEAAVTNLSLGQIVKLITENSTTKEEKKEIINRFGNVKTVNESKSLYENLSKELKKRNLMNINEEKQFSTNGSQKINETQIYRSKDLLDSLDLMHRICK